MSYTKTKRAGYSVKETTTGRVNGKLPFFCPRIECRRITDTTDDRYLLDYGICANCYITLVEGRQKPLIDIESYRLRLIANGS